MFYIRAKSKRNFLRFKDVHRNVYHIEIMNNVL